MMKVPEQYRITEVRPGITVDFIRIYGSQPGDKRGSFYIPRQSTKKGNYFMAMASSAYGWEHVSVSIPTEHRCPTWEEMCYIKDLFWDDYDTVMQLHPPKSEYVNNHPHCLHLWKPTNQTIPLPDSILVGIKNAQ